MSEPTTAAVHDLGYARYDGPRRPQALRHRAIARNVLAMAWRGKWRLRMCAIGTAFIVAGCAVYLYVVTFITGNTAIRGMTHRNTPLHLADAVLPSAFDLCTGVAFLLGLSVAARVVADDLRAGAFEFYFARPLRVRDYVAGKLLGVAAVMAVPALAGPALIAIARIAMAGSGAGAIDGLDLLPRTLVCGVLATAAYASVPVAISALARRRAFTIAGWAVLYLVVGTASSAIAIGTDTPWVAAASLKSALMAVIHAVLDVQVTGQAAAATPPLAAAIPALAVYIIAAVAVLVLRVRAAARAGIGGRG